MKDTFSDLADRIAPGNLFVRMIAEQLDAGRRVEEITPEIEAVMKELNSGMRHL